MKRQDRGFPGQTADQRAAQDDFQQAHRSAKRKLNTFLHFWKFCASPACRRVRRCGGDPLACFTRFWPHVPDDIKDEVRATIAERAGKPDLAQTYRRAAETSRMQQPPCEPSPPAIAPPPVPRIRTL